jgi:hypothetical protein
VNEDLMESPTEKKDASRGSTLLTVPFMFKVNGLARLEGAPPTATTNPSTFATRWRVLGATSDVSERSMLEGKELSSRCVLRPQAWSPPAQAVEVSEKPVPLSYVGACLLDEL